MGCIVDSDFRVGAFVLGHYSRKRLSPLFREDNFNGYVVYVLMIGFHVFAQIQNVLTFFHVITVHSIA